MDKFEILVDTTQDFTFEIAEEFNLRLIPYYLELDDKNLQDLIEIDKDTFYKNIDSYDKLSTGVPPISDVLDEIEKIKKKGINKAIAITSSSDITGMYNVYKSVKEMVEDFDLEIIDTNTVGSAAGLISILASRYRQDRKSFEETVDFIKKIKDKSSIYAVFRTLDNLVKGGRISPLKAAIGGFLNIYPILTIKNRKVDILEKARGQNKSLDKLSQIVKDEIKDSKDYCLAIFQGDNKEEFLALKDKLKDQIENSGLYIETILTPVLGVHAGSKVVGVSVVRLD